MSTVPPTSAPHGSHDPRDETLELLLDLHEVGVPATRTRLAERVGADAAGRIVTSLVDEGSIEDSDGHLTLTTAGHAAAVRVVRTHRLAERLLRDVIGLEWWKVHREAAAWEQVISADVEARLVELLGDPGTCPHGNPIPGSANRPDQREAVRLVDAPEGLVDIVRIAEELEEDDEALLQMERCGFIPGRQAEIAGHEADGVKVIGSVADGVLPAHVAALTYVRPRSA